MRDETIILFIISGVFLIGVFIWIITTFNPKTMTNEQIIQETKKCNQAGLKTYPLYNITSETIRIICEEKSE